MNKLLATSDPPISDWLHPKRTNIPVWIDDGAIHEAGSLSIFYICELKIQKEKNEMVAY